jgi:hypothetical protein
LLQLVVELSIKLHQLSDCHCLDLQNKDGSDAKTFCAAEFTDCTKQFEGIAAKVLEEAYGEDQEKIQQNQPIFSWDNASVHVGGDKVIGPKGTPFRAPLPPHSPDMHKVIEHVFNRCANYFKHIVPALFHECEHHTLALWPQLVESYLFHVEQLQWVRADVDSLKKTYQFIKDHNGDVCPRPLN